MHMNRVMYFLGDRNSFAKSYPGGRSCFSLRKQNQNRYLFFAIANRSRPARIYRCSH